MVRARFLAIAALAAASVTLPGCTRINERHGFVADPVLASAIQPGIDNQQSVQGTLGRPTFVSQYGEPTWYYVSSINSRRPFMRPRISQHSVLAVQFDAAGNVRTAERTGLDKVVYLSPDGDATPTLGRERSFFEDLFGNIGAVGAAGVGGQGGPAN